MKKVIFVDDDKDMLKLLGIILGKTYEVHLYSDATNLMEHIQDVQPDLLVLDNLIGDHSSESIIHSLEANQQVKIPPIILHSGTPDLIARAEKIHAVGFLAKPSSITEIKNYIDSFLNPGSN